MKSSASTFILDIFVSMGSQFGFRGQIGIPTHLSRLGFPLIGSAPTLRCPPFRHPTLPGSRQGSSSLLSLPGWCLLYRPSGRADPGAVPLAYSLPQGPPFMTKRPTEFLPVGGIISRRGQYVRIKILKTPGAPPLRKWLNVPLDPEAASLQEPNRLRKNPSALSY